MGNQVKHCTFVIHKYTVYLFVKLFSESSGDLQGVCLQNKPWSSASHRVVAWQRRSALCSSAGAVAAFRSFRKETAARHAA